MAKPTLRELFGKRVRELRKAAGFSQEGFALAVSIDRSHYGLLERGRVNATLDTIERIAKALKVPVRDLFE